MEKHPSRKSLFHGEFMRAEYGTRVTQFIYRARAFISFLEPFKQMQKSDTNSIEIRGSNKVESIFFFVFEMWN